MKHYKKKAVLIIIGIIMSLLLTGCTDEQPKIDNNEPEHSYSCEQVACDITGSVDTLATSEEEVFFTTCESSESLDVSKFRLYSLNFNSSEFNEYEQFSIPSEGRAWGLAVSGEKIFTIVSELEVNNGEENINYSLVLFNKSDTTLTNIDFNDINGYSVSDESIPNSILVDSEENMYVLWGGPAPKLVVYNTQGGLGFLFELNVSNSARLIKTSDGTILLGQKTSEGYEIKTIDFEKKAWGKAMYFEESFTNCYNGAEYWLYLDDGDIVYGYDIDKNSLTKVLSWTDCGIGRPNTTIPIASGDFLYTDQLEDGGTRNLMRLVCGESLDEEKTVLTFSVMNDNYGLYSTAVRDFNSSHTDIKIKLIDYSKYSTSDSKAGETKMAIDIITGNIPDIIALSELPSSQFAAKGLLENLYPYIDNDPEISRDDFLQSILASSEFDGGLYELIPSFYIQTVLGKTSEVGDGYSWTIEQYNEYAKSTNYGNMFGENLSRAEFLTNALNYNSALFMDWETKTCKFDSKEFIGLLKIASEIKEVAGVGFEAGDYNTWYNEAGSILNGEQALMYCVLGDPSLDRFKAIFNQDISFIGFPTSEGNGSSIYPTMSLGISTTSKNKKAAWEFLRTFVLENSQVNTYLGGLPTTKAGMQRIIDNYKNDAFENGDASYEGPNFSISFKMQPDYSVPKFLDLINALDKINRPNNSVNKIVLDEASAFFAGDKSAEEAAKLIQQRASIYMSEQG